MVTLLNDKDFRSIRGLPFCYLCGHAFTPEDSVNRDHVPPKNVFAVADRVRPLILPTHEACNGAESDHDERAVQLLAGLGGRDFRNAKNLKLAFHRFPIPGSAGYMEAVSGVSIEYCIARWVRAFHAALYREPLRVDTKFSICTPFPAGRLGKEPTAILAPQPVHTAIVGLIRKQRAIGRLDRLLAWRGKCVYECVWDSLDDGSPCCLFALKIYDWERLGRTPLTEPRGCVGIYRCTPPEGAAVASTVEIATPLLNQLDPFTALYDRST